MRFLKDTRPVHKKEDNEVKSVPYLNRKIDNETNNFLPKFVFRLKKLYQEKVFLNVQRLFDNKVISIEDYYVNLVLIKEEKQNAKENKKCERSNTQNKK